VRPRNQDARLVFSVGAADAGSSGHGCLG
jgi:hypothetical protein